MNMKTEQTSARIGVFRRQYNLDNSFLRGLFNPLGLTILQRFEFLNRNDEESLNSDWENVWNDFSSVVCNQ